MRARHLITYGGLILMMGCAPRLVCVPQPLFTCAPIDLNFECGGFSSNAGGSDPFEEDSDVFVPDDDDDSALDDPFSDGPYTAATFTMTLHVEAPVGDDDDSAAGWSLVPASGTYEIAYWTDSAATDLYCVQTMAWSGSALPGEATPSCDICSGYVGVEIQSVDDISTPETDADACDIEDILDDGTLGHRLLLAGDSFTRLATVDAETVYATDISWWDGEITLDAATAQLPAGAQFSHLGFIRVDSGGTLSGIESFTDQIGTNNAWAPLWVMGVMPGDGDPDSAALQGDYVGVAMFGLR